MKIGYACLTVGVPFTNFKTCSLKNATEENLLSIIGHNLTSLDRIIDYNIENNIKLFRISSDIIPFGSSPGNKLSWWELFSSKLQSIGDKIKNAQMRVSMHPGQYTVINSPKEDVVERAIKDLEYHARFLDALQVDRKNKIILHIGGIYGEKKIAMERFKKNYKRLSQDIKKRLVIENDDKSYNIKEVLELGEALKIPVVYDNLHNKVLAFDPRKEDSYWIDRCRKTWRKEDGTQKIHYSQQNPDKRPGSHSQSIDLVEFEAFIKNVDINLESNIDIMLEVKDKNLSAIKANNYLTSNKKISNLELEWSKYKYNILEHSPENYNKIRQLLKEKASYPTIDFYQLIDEALKKEARMGQSINAAQHVWGYFKSLATEDEMKKFESYLKRYKSGNFSIKALKNLLWKMTVKYQESYLLNSYYFHF